MKNEKPKNSVREERDAILNLMIKMKMEGVEPISKMSNKKIRGFSVFLHELGYDATTLRKMWEDWETHGVGFDDVMSRFKL